MKILYLHAQFPRRRFSSIDFLWTRLVHHTLLLIGVSAYAVTGSFLIAPRGLFVGALLCVILNARFRGSVFGLGQLLKIKLALGIVNRGHFVGDPVVKVFNTLIAIEGSSDALASSHS